MPVLETQFSSVSTPVLAPSLLPSLAETWLEKALAFIDAEKSHPEPVLLSCDEAALIRLIEKRVKQPQLPAMIGMAGMSASGKTTLGKLIHQTFNLNQPVPQLSHLRTDNYYLDISEQVAAAGGFSQFISQTGYSFDEPSALDLPLLRRDLQMLAAGKQAKIPHYVMNVCSVEPEAIAIDPAPVILADGLYLLRPELRDVWDLAVFVEADPTVVEERWFTRAMAQSRFMEDPGATQILFNDVMQRAEQHVLPTAALADVVLNGNVGLKRFKTFSARLFALLNPC